MPTDSMLLLADSFRVRVSPATGRAEVRGFSRHLDRFQQGVARVASELMPRLPGFVQHCRAEIDRAGACFPRFEVTIPRSSMSPQLALSIRPLPQLTGTVTMRTVSLPDLSFPDLKGPNIARFRALNTELGAEALRLDASGHVVEGATTSVFWWSNEDGQPRTVSSPAHHGLDRVASVTEGLLTDIAQMQPGVTLSSDRVAPAALRQHEVWAVNALHGIRLVTAIDGEPTRPAARERWQRWQDLLDRTWEPVCPEHPRDRVGTDGAA